MARLLLIAAVARLLTLTALADGCFVFKWNKNIDINEPTQKAIIVYDKGREDLLLQVKYQGPLQEFGWLVPVPSEPKVERGSMDAFYELSQLTQMSFGAGAMGGVTMSARGAARETESAVKVIETKTVGAYEISILSANDASALQTWLRANGYSIPQEKTEIIDEYIRKGWSFMAAKINLGKASGFRQIVSKASAQSVADLESTKTVQRKLASGELHPLLISFDTPKCVFPLKISAVAGKPSEVSLYLLTHEPLLNRFLFEEAARKLEREYSDWDLGKNPMAGRVRIAAQDRREMFLAQMLEESRDRNAPHGGLRGRDWTRKDLEAMIREAAPPDPPPSLLNEYPYGDGSLLWSLPVGPEQLGKSALSLPRINGKHWYVTKFRRTFAASEMRDLEFEPAAPVLAELLPRSSGRTAADELGLLREKGLLFLLEACKSKDSSTRLNGTFGIARLNDPRVIDQLPTLLSDENPKVRLRAAYAASFNYEDRLHEPIIKLLGDPYHEIREQAIDCLTMREKRDLTAEYLKLLNDADANVRLGSLTVLARVNSDAVPAEPLIRLVQDRDPDIRHRALLIAQRKPDLVPRAELLRLLGSGNMMNITMAKMLIERKAPLTSPELYAFTTNRLGYARLMSLKALQRNADAQAVELLLPMLRDTNRVVRSRAFSTIKTVTGHEISDTDPALWEKWWEANKNKPLATKASP